MGNDARAMVKNPLEGRRILVVEDEYYLAEDLAEAIRAAGGEVVGPVGNLAEAEDRVAQGGFDCAVLDMNLRGEFVFPVARRLEGVGVPFVVTTGYSSGALPFELERHRRIDKPFDQQKVVEAVTRMLGEASPAVTSI